MGINLTCVLLLQDDEETLGKEKERVTPGKLRLTFEEQEKERQEQQRKQAEEEAKKRLQEERKAFEEAKLGMVRYNMHFYLFIITQIVESAVVSIFHSDVDCV